MHDDTWNVSEYANYIKHKCTQTPFVHSATPGIQNHLWPWFRHRTHMTDFDSPLQYPATRYLDLTSGNQTWTSVNWTIALMNVVFNVREFKTDAQGLYQIINDNMLATVYALEGKTFVKVFSIEYTQADSMSRKSLLHYRNLRIFQVWSLLKSYSKSVNISIYRK